MNIEENLKILGNFNMIELFILFYIENLLIAVIGITIGFVIDGNTRITPKLISKTEILWTISTVLFNSVITLLGYQLYLKGIVTFNFEFNIKKLILDFIILVFSMDLLMYLFHLGIHRFSFVYKYHNLHHHYDKPTPISLFVLHPVEVLGFGILWLLLLTFYNFSFFATMIYLIFNIIMGLIGHMEKEFIPEVIKNNKYLKWFATTSFHRDHHADEHCNYGFYTNIWDKMFNTWKE